MKIYKPSQFAGLVGVHIKTLQKWDRAGVFPARRSPTNRRYYTEEDYQKYLEGKSHQSEQEREGELAEA